MSLSGLPDRDDLMDDFALRCSRGPNLPDRYVIGARARLQDANPPNIPDRELLASLRPEFRMLGRLGKLAPIARPNRRRVCRR